MFLLPSALDFFWETAFLSIDNSADGIGLLNLLLAKSGANMLNALTRFIQSIEALERIAVKLAN
jgi:hypothetical protein